MAMGFMVDRLLRTIALYSIGAAGMCLCAVANAADVAVAGVFPGKAVLVVDGGTPRAVSVGARTPEGIRLVAVDGDAAVVEVDRKSTRLNSSHQKSSYAVFC